MKTELRAARLLDRSLIDGSLNESTIINEKDDLIGKLKLEILSLNEQIELLINTTRIATPGIPPLHYFPRGKGQERVTKWK